MNSQRRELKIENLKYCRTDLTDSTDLLIASDAVALGNEPLMSYFLYGLIKTCF